MRYLKELNWLPFNRDVLEKLIAEKANAGNYAVFDWDYSCIFYDTQDSLFIYQIDNLLFKLKPQEFSRVIRHGLNRDEDVDFKNLSGDKVLLNDLCEDLDKLYQFLYSNYEGLDGDKPLSFVRETREFKDFKVKIFLLMKIGYTISRVDLAQTVSTGFNIEEYNSMVERSIDHAINLDIATISLKSSGDGLAGACDVTYNEGIRIQKEIQDLVHAMNQNGIETYVCSASQRDNIRVFASNPKYGYGFKLENVFGRIRVFEDGILTEKLDPLYPNPTGKGKTETIKKFLVEKHGGKSPILIAGDSDGDYYMMDAFKDDALLLILDKNLSSDNKIYSMIQEAKNSRGDISTRVILQPRSLSTGIFLPFE